MTSRFEGTMGKLRKYDLPFQRLGDRRVLCMLCARVFAATAKATHERGIEHRSALAELAGRKAS